MNMNPAHQANQHPMLKLSTQQQARLDELIDACELARDAGKEMSEADLCADDPNLLEPLLHAISQLKAVDKMLATVPTLPIPKRIGEFIVVEPLGTGATGMVFRCRQRNPNREVAVKVLKPLLEATEQHRRFQREVAALSVIQQDGIAAIFQSGVTDWCGTPCFWIAMELLDGGDVCQYLKNQPTSEANVLKAFRSICETLRAAHRLGILHRDLKPSNILMSDEGIPHLVDFGVAKLPESFEGVHQTEQGVRAVRGTAAWTAPELLLSERPVADVRSEIFSLGVVLFEMLTGTHPFAADRLTTPQIAARITQRTAVPISTALPNASVDLVAFTARLMAFDPDERYQNLDDVLSDLDRLQNGEPVHVRSVPITEQVWRTFRRHQIRIVMASIAGCAILLALASLRFGHQKTLETRQKTIQLVETERRHAETRKKAKACLHFVRDYTFKSALSPLQQAGDLQRQHEMLRGVGLLFEEFLKDSPDDREIREDAGSAFHLLGIAANRLSLADESLASFQRAEQIFAGLKRDYPDDRSLEFDLFHTVFGQSGTIVEKDRKLELHDWCHRLIRRLHAAEPKNTDYKDALACVLVELGYDHAIESDHRDLKRARQRCLESRQLVLELAADPNCKPLHRKHIGTSAAVLRVIANVEGNISEALEWAAVGVTAQEKFIQDFPDPDSRATLANYQLAHASASLAVGDVATARTSLEAAERIFNEIASLLQQTPTIQLLEDSLRVVQKKVELAEHPRKLNNPG